MYILTKYSCLLYTGVMVFSTTIFQLYCGSFIYINWYFQCDFCLTCDKSLWMWKIGDHSLPYHHLCCELWVKVFQTENLNSLLKGMKPRYKFRWKIRVKTQLFVNLFLFKPLCNVLCLISSWDLYRNCWYTEYIVNLKCWNINFVCFSFRNPTPKTFDTAKHFKNVTWLQYNLFNHSYLEIGNKSHNLMNFRQNFYGFWRQYFPQLYNRPSCK